MKVKTLSRADWARILEREQAFLPLHFRDFCGYAGLLLMHKVSAPLSVPVLNESVKIVDDGFAWLQIAPEGENWWLTVMFDRENNIVQYYFDISLENEIDGERSWFTDLYLDVVLLPDGRIALLDRDELDEALSGGTIDEDQHALAVKTAKMLMDRIPRNRSRLEAFCRNIAGLLREKLLLQRNV